MMVQALIGFRRFFQSTRRVVSSVSLTTRILLASLGLLSQAVVFLHLQRLPSDNSSMAALENVKPKVIYAVVVESNG